MELSGEIVGVIVGAVFTGGIGILIACFTEDREKKRTKNLTFKDVVKNTIGQPN